MSDSRPKVKQNKSFDHLPVTICHRDANGLRTTSRFPNVSNLYNHITGIFFDNEEDEILAVFWGDQCIYSALGNNPITWQDIVGFFA